MTVYMTDKLKWGLIGTGNIAKKFARGLQESVSGELAAIGSRTEAGARAFAADFPAVAYGSYDALLADPNVQAVYISTPHPMHAEWAIKAAQAGKHILCEKPITMNRAEAETVVEAARSHGVFLMEAFMYRCHPQTAKLLELLRAQTIGQVKLIRATFSFSVPFNTDSRLFNKALGGGGILDVGCYCTSMSRLIAGAVSGAAFEDPVRVKGVGCIGQESGVDEYAVADLAFRNGVIAQLAAGVALSLENNVRIVGTEGIILVPSPWVVSSQAGFTKILVFKDNIPEEIVIESERGVYAIEADHVAEQIRAGRKESPAMPWADTLGNMQTLDDWRAEVGE